MHQIHSVLRSCQRVARINSSRWQGLARAGASPPLKLRRPIDQTSTFAQNHPGAQGQDLTAVTREMRPENITHTYKVHSNKL